MVHQLAQFWKSKIIWESNRCLQNLSKNSQFWFYVHILNTFWLVTIFVNKGLSQMPPDRKEICILAKCKDFYKICSNKKYVGEVPRAYISNIFKNWTLKLSSLDGNWSVFKLIFFKRKTYNKSAYKVKDFQTTI